MSVGSNGIHSILAFSGTSVSVLTFLYVQAIVLDTDLTFAADITELWQHFTAMRRKNKVRFLTID